jgi:small subunit ribosomal protein S5e
LLPLLEMRKSNFSTNGNCCMRSGSCNFAEIADTPFRTFNDVFVSDLSLEDYITVKGKIKNTQWIPHSAGRWNVKRFRKASCPIVERLTNSLMMHGRNNGKKLLAVRIVKHTFELIHLLTDKNPIQVRGAMIWLIDTVFPGFFFFFFIFFFFFFFFFFF